jgi:hypothetical protein
VSGFAYPLHWHFVGQPADNQAVVELNTTPLSENRQLVFARIANFGGNAVRRAIILEVDGYPIDRAAIDLPANSSLDQVWEISSSQALEASVWLQGGDVLETDDAASVGLEPEGSIRVALVAENPAPLQQAIEAIPGAVLQVIPPESYHESLQEANGPFELTIFRDFLPASWPVGQVLVVEPPLVSETLQEVSLAPGASALLSQFRQDIPLDAALQAPNPDPLLAGIDFAGRKPGNW